MTQTVLILDDEESVLELTALYLRDRGYQTLSSTNPEAATERLLESNSNVDLLIADVNLSGSSGVQAGVGLKELAPQLKLLFVSGYTHDEWNARDAALLKRVAADSVRILGKPFSSRQLLAQVTALIGEPVRGAKPATPTPDEMAANRKRVITALERQAGLLELAYDAILVRDLRGNIRYWNRGAEMLYGWSRDQAVGQFSHDLLGTVFPLPFEQLERELVEKGRWEGELKHTVKDGGTVTVSSRWAVRDSVDGQIEILEINRDITEQKHAEKESARRLEELTQAEAMFRGLLESAPDAMVIVRQDGRIALVNAQVERQFGYTRDELIGENVDKLVPSRFRERHPEHRRGYVAKSHVRPMGQGLDLYALRKNGEEFPVEICLSPLRMNDELFISSSIRDVSERKRLEIVLREKNLELEQADKAKDMFLASMSHELRSPLHTIIGFADLLHEELKGPLNSDQQRFIQHILSDSQHLLALINDILDLSKIEAGGLRLKMETFDSASAIDEVVSSLRPQLDVKGLNLATDLAGDVAIHADHLRFKQVLVNLLSNSVKFTPQGGTITVSSKSSGEFAEIAVCDTGVGIPESEHESVFDKFHQVGATTKGVREGTGLGLPITRALVEHHGGKIRLTSAPGQGSCFTCTFPLATAA